MTAAAAAAAESEAALPVVDLRSFDSVEDLAADLMRVGKDPGFFYVVGHELRDDVAADMFALAQTFFSSPLEEKLAYANGSGDLVSFPALYSTSRLNGLVSCPSLFLSLSATEDERA